MRQFAEAYSLVEISQQAVGQITWSHNIQLFSKVKKQNQRFRYAQQAVEHGRSRNVLAIQIERQLFEAR